MQAKTSMGQSLREEQEMCGDINRTVLALNVKGAGDKQGGREVAAAFININERKMLISQFLDNDHLSFLESFIIQLNNSNHDSRFEVLVHMPAQNTDPVLYDKLHDLLALCEVVYQTTQGTHSTATAKTTAGRNSMGGVTITKKDFDH